MLLMVSKCCESSSPGMALASPIFQCAGGHYVLAGVLLPVPILRALLSLLFTASQFDNTLH